jgi:hypothetical protein
VIVCWSIGICSFHHSAGFALSTEFPAAETRAPVPVLVNTFVDELVCDQNVGFSPYVEKLNPNHPFGRKFDEVAKGFTPPFIHVALAPIPALEWMEWWEGVLLSLPNFVYCLSVF